MTVWHDMDTAPTDREIVLGWRATPSQAAWMTLATWDESHANGAGWYGEQWDSTWGFQAYENPDVWTDAPELPAAKSCETCLGAGVYDSYDATGRALEFECYTCDGTGRHP